MDGFGRRRLCSWRTQVSGSMRALGVVVRRILGEHRAKVPLSEDQHAVGEFGAGGQDEAFGVTVRPRAASRILTTSMPASWNTASNDAANWPARSRMRNRNCSAVKGQLNRPAGGQEFSALVARYFSPTAAR